MGPRDPGATAEIARVTGIEAHSMPQPLAHLERDADSPLRVSRRGEAYADRVEDAELQKVRARFLDRDGGVGLAAMQQQSPPQESFVHALQPLELDRTDLDARSSHGVKTHVQHVVFGVLIGDGCIDLGERKAVILKGREQARARRKDVGGDRGRAGGESQLAAREVRDRSIDLDAAGVVQRPEDEGDLAERVLSLRQRAQGLAETRLIERLVIDRDSDRAVVIAKAIEYRLEPIDIAAGARDQSKRGYGNRLAQRLKLRRCLEGRIE